MVTKNLLTRQLNEAANFSHSKVLECEGNSGEFVELVPEQLNYLGPKDLTQYFIRSKDGWLQNWESLGNNLSFSRQTNMSLDSGGNIEVEVVLGRFPNNPKRIHSFKQVLHETWITQGGCWAPSSPSTFPPCSLSSSPTWPTTSRAFSLKPSSLLIWLWCWWVSFYWPASLTF